MTGPERLTKEELTDAFASHFEVLSIYETRSVRLLALPPRPRTFLAKRVPRVRFDMTEHYRENLPQPPLAWCGIFKKLTTL
jgi:hypothetical protein